MCGSRLTSQYKPAAAQKFEHEGQATLTKRSQKLRTASIWVLSVVVVCGCFVLIAPWAIVTFVARTYYIVSGAMLPTLQIHDLILVDKLGYHFHAPRRGDIAVFPPAVPSPDDFIKRVVGLPGDTFRIKRGNTIINGQPVGEAYILDKPTYELAVRNYGIYVNYGAGWHALDAADANVPPKVNWVAPDRLPPHCYIVLGDNRNDSEDSHIWGCAQDKGTFYTGPRAGQPARFTGRASRIIAPANHVRDL